MRALCLGLLLAAVSAAAQTNAPAELFSIAQAQITPVEVGDIITSGQGRYVVVGDRFVDVAASQKAGSDVPLSKPEGDALVAARLKARVDHLRAAAHDGSLTAQDRAEARALSVLRGGMLAWSDRYLLDSLNPGDVFVAGPPAPKDIPEPGPAGVPDPLLAQMRSRLDLDDHGDPKQAAALDMAVRLMLQSPTARELSAGFVKLDRRVKVSFETIDGSLVDGEAGHKHVTGIGGLTTHAGGDWVRINAGYLQADSDAQFHDVPGTLAHELLGHVYNEVLAENAGASSAMNLWRGDEENAGVTGWLVQAEIDGRMPSDGYLWRYLADPEGYRRDLHLVTSYYAEGLSSDEAARRDEVYVERLGRVQARIDALQAQLADRTDWGAIIDHFETAHEVRAWRLRGLRDDLLHPATAAINVELGRLIDIRRTLTADLADAKDPVHRALNADLAKSLSAPFFVDAEKRLDALSGRLRTFAKDHQNPSVTYGPATPGITVTESIGWDELRRMYQDDKRDHPEHWPPAAPKP